MLKKLDKLIRLLLIVVVFSALAKSLVIDPGNSSINAGRIEQINDRWELAERKLDGVYHYDYQYTIPENIENDLVLSLKSARVSYKVFVDGKEISAFSDCNEELGERRTWIEIPDYSQGKLLTLRLYGKEGLIERTMKNAMFLGEKNAVFTKCLRINFHAQLFFLFSVIFAVVFFFCERELKSKLSRKNIREMRYLEAFILDTGVWVLTDSQFLHIFWKKQRSYP